MKNAKKPMMSGAGKKGQDLGAYIVSGFAIGALIGLILDNLVLGMGIGMCIGIVLGAIASSRTNPYKE